MGGSRQWTDTEVQSTDKYFYTNKRPLPKSLTCRSEGAKRPKNLSSTRKYEILRYAQDDNMALSRGLNKQSKGGTGVPPVQAQAKACDYIKQPFECHSV
jgi:hypothetical protein